MRWIISKVVKSKFLHKEKSSNDFLLSQNDEHLSLTGQAVDEFVFETKWMDYFLKGQV